MEASRFLHGPPAMVLAGFEGGLSLSQKNLEQARTKFLLDKLTGKLPPELRSGFGQMLPPITKDDPLKRITKSKGTMSVSSKSRAGDKEVKIAEVDQKGGQEASL